MVTPASLPNSVLNLLGESSWLKSCINNKLKHCMSCLLVVLATLMVFSALWLVHHNYGPTSGIFLVSVCLSATKRDALFFIWASIHHIANPGCLPVNDIRLNMRVKLLTSCWQQDPKRLTFQSPTTVQWSTMAGAPQIFRQTGTSGSVNHSGRTKWPCRSQNYVYFINNPNIK